MEELYWIGRLDIIYHFSLFLCITCLVLSLIGFIWWSFASDGEHNQSEAKMAKSMLKIAVPIACITLLLAIFTPCKREAYMIYGIGGTIDYVRSDSVATKLPHKAIMAIDSYLEDINKNKNKE